MDLATDKVIYHSIFKTGSHEILLLNAQTISDSQNLEFPSRGRQAEGWSGWLRAGRANERAGRALDLRTQWPSEHKALGEGVKVFGQDRESQPFIVHPFGSQHIAQGTTRPGTRHSTQVVVE